MSDQDRRADLRARIKKYGRQAVTLEEMLRLGFWPPESLVADQRERSLAELHLAQAELSDLRAAIAKVEGQISDAHDLDALIAEIRKRRIARVHALREQRRAEKLRQQQERSQADKQRRRERPPFLGHGVSAGLQYQGGDAARVASLGLPALTTASDIAAAIGIDASALTWLTYHRGAATIDHYHRFTIPKRGGGTRVISSPKRRLRLAQRWLLQAILTPIPVHDAAMAFRPARSIAQNAALHQGRAIVIRIDLKDFFPSINFRRVKGLFQSFGYNEGVSSILALLATEVPRLAVTLDGDRRFVSIGDRQLPQGACTSPALTNILCRTLDARLQAVARSAGFTYSRYADDIVFSHPNSGAALGCFLTLVQRIIGEESFVINEKKTRIMRPQHRQTVTGLVVNQEPHLSRTDLRRFRAFLHHCETEGFDAMSTKLGKNARAYAKGYLSFLHMVSPKRRSTSPRSIPGYTRQAKPPLDLGVVGPAFQVGAC